MQITVTKTDEGYILDIHDSGMLVHTELFKLLPTIKDEQRRTTFAFTQLTTTIKRSLAAYLL